MNVLLVYFSVSLLSAFFFALLEIQIEGKSGWAELLPTWKVKFKWSKFLPGLERPLTGYHFYLWLFLFIYPHISFVFTDWTFSKELFLLSFILLITLIEDFLWFVFNPHFGLKKFRSKFIPWHKPWLGPFPLSYYFGLLLWIFLFNVSLSK